MSTRRIHLGLTCGVAALAAALIGCGHGPAPNAADQPLVVRYVEPTEEPVTYYEFFTGRTDAAESVEVRARVTGYLDEVKFKPGQEVKKGDILFQIDPRTYKAELERDKGQIALAEARVKLADAELARTLGSGIGTSEADKDKARAAKDEASAALRAIKSNTAISELNVSFCEVTSPVGGIVGRNLLTVGNLVVKDQTMLTTIVSQDPMFAYFDIDERTLLRVQDYIRKGEIKTPREGGKFMVQFGLASEGDDYPHEGMIDFVNNQLDTSTGTIQIRGNLPNPVLKGSTTRLLVPGLFIRVRIPIGDAQKGLLVPQAAIGSDQSKKYVYVVNDKNTVERRYIEAGAIQASGLQVVEPVSIIRTEKGIQPARKGEKGEPSLKLGDKVIVNGLQRVRPGLVVTPKPFDAPDQFAMT